MRSLKNIFESEQKPESSHKRKKGELEGIALTGLYVCIYSSVANICVNLESNECESNCFFRSYCIRRGISLIKSNA